MLTHQHLPGATLISVVGDLDISTCGRMDTYIQQARQEPGDHLVFDMTRMTFMDSSGLRVLVNTHSFSVRQGGSMRLAGVQRLPARIFEITGVDRLIPLHVTVADALAALELD